MGTVHTVHCVHFTVRSCTEVVYQGGGKGEGAAPADRFPIRKNSVVRLRAERHIPFWGAYPKG